MVLTTSSPVLPKMGELSITELEELYVQVLDQFVMSREKDIIKALDNYHRGRVGVKAMTQFNIFADFAKILSAAAIYKKIKGIIGEIVTRAVENVEVDLDVNITDFSPVFKENLTRFNFEKIKGMNDDLVTELGESLMEGWREGEGIKELKGRVQKVYSNGNLTNARAEAIARTETNRAYNLGRLQAAKDSGVRVLKRWDAHHDSRTGSDSIKLEKRYYNNPILLDDDFYDEEKDQWISTPPSRTNCRCRVEFLPMED